MFDWNDEELANIIWGEHEERDDHIVPYPDDNKDYQNKKEQDQDDSAGKLAGKKPQGEKHDFPDPKLRSTSQFDKHGNSSSSGLSMDSWPHLGSSDFIINGQESINSEVSNDVMETDDSVKGETSQHHGDHPMFENAQGEEDTDYAGYGWENIGSFDDLDRIFSNDEPLFGNVLGNTDYQWPSKDVTTISRNSPNRGSEALTDSSEILQAKSENVAQDDLSCSFVFGKVDDPASLSFSRPNALLGHTTYGDRSKTVVKDQSNCPTVGANAASSHCVADKSETINELSDKISRPKKHQKGQRKMEGKIQRKSMRDVQEAWPTPANSSDQYEHLQETTPSVSQLRQMQGPQSFYYHYPSHPYLYVPTFGNAANPYPGKPSVSHSHSGVYKGQAMLSGYEASRAEVTPVKKQLDSLDKPPAMTPQEKIEKLRRRQQMQAMLAIQKQQEQFGQQVCSSVAQESPSRSQPRLVEGSELDLDDTSPLPSTETSPAVEQGDSSSISGVVVDYAAEEMVLRRLQDVIAKLDSRIRECIRDSLFRLAKSAEQRNYTSDIISTSKQTNADDLSGGVGVAKEVEINPENKVVKMADVETDTNPIDRTIAHLLFHRPMESTVKHPAGTPESPCAKSLPSTSGNKVLNEANLPSSGVLPNGSETESHQRQGSPTTTHHQKDTQQAEVLTTSASADTCITTAAGPPHGDDVTMELEASQ